MAKASSKIDPKKAPAKGPNGPDLLSLKTWRWLGPLLAALIIGARLNRHLITPVVAVLLVRYCAALGDAWEGQQRQRGGLKATILAGLLFGMYWPAPWHGWMLIAYIGTPIALAVYATITIGQSGNESRQLAKVQTGFAAVSKHLPAGARSSGTPTVTDKVKRIRFTLPTGSPKWDPRAAALNIAQEAGLSAPQVDITPLHHDKAGMYELRISDGRPFDFPDPTYPAVDTWPKQSFPLAWDADGDTVWLNMGGSNGKHMVIAGRTGSGKSNTQRVILAGLHHLKFDLWLIDPHHEFEDYHHHAQRVATSTTDGAKLMAELVAEMRARLADKSLPRPRICAMVDETPAVLAIKGADANANALAMEGRKVGIVLVFAVQYPTVDLFGGPLRQQMSTVIVHRVKDATGSNVALGQGAKGDGWDASDKRRMARQGRAIAELEGADEARQYVQVFPAPEAPPAPVDTWDPPMVWAAPSAASVRPPSEGTDQGEQAADSGRTDTPADSPATDLEARILPVLNGHALSGREIAKLINASPDGVNKALKRMAKRGAARYDGGWLRASS